MFKNFEGRGDKAESTLAFVLTKVKLSFWTLGNWKKLWHKLGEKCKGWWISNPRVRCFFCHHILRRRVIVTLSRLDFCSRDDWKRSNVLHWNNSSRLNLCYDEPNFVIDSFFIFLITVGKYQIMGTSAVVRVLVFQIFSIVKQSISFQNHQK